MISKSRFSIIQMMIAAALMILVAGCSKGKDDDDNNNNDPSGIEPLITASVLNSGNPVEATSIYVAMVDINHQGAAITNAIVKVNNQVVPHEITGVYTLLITDNPILPGSNVNLEVQCGGETYTASVVMPASGSANVPVSGCAAGSILVVGHN